MKLIIKKILSYLIDSLILGGLVSIYLFSFQVFYLQQSTQKEAMFMLICALITILILTSYIPTKTNGQTLGQKIMKLKVINKNGKPRTYIQSFIRECIVKFSLSTLFIPFVIIYSLIYMIRYRELDFELPHDTLLKDYVITQ